MMLLQMENGHIDPNWFFGGLIVLLLIGFWAMLKANLKIMTTMLTKHDDKLNDHETRITVIEKLDNKNL